MKTSGNSRGSYQEKGVNPDPRSRKKIPPGICFKPEREGTRGLGQIFKGIRAKSERVSSPVPADAGDDTAEKSEITEERRGSSDGLGALGRTAVSEEGVLRRGLAATCGLRSLAAAGQPGGRVRTRYFETLSNCRSCTCCRQDRHIQIRIRSDP